MLERLDYVVDEQRIWLRTLHEADGSSLCDEGYVAFRRRPDGGTRIAVLACVYLPMPRLLVATHLQRWEWLKRTLIVRAHRRFFDRTIGNIEATYAGRNFSIGREVG